MHMFDALPSSVRLEPSKLSDGINHHPENKGRSERNYERLTRREVEELMNVNCDRYKRVNGKVRRR